MKESFMTFIKRCSAKMKQEQKQPATPLDNPPDYFQTAKGWHDDYYTTAVASRNRYRLAFYVAMGLAVLLSLSVASLVPAQRLVPIAIHHYADGDVDVAPITNPHPPTNLAQTESHIVRYIQNRESYSADSYDVQYKLVMLLSNEAVAKQYVREQSVDNQTSPINTLGRKATKLVHVESVVFLDNESAPNQVDDHVQHHNLAQVNFRVSVKEKDGNHRKTVPLTALVGWTYHGIPSDPNKLWQNWDGFQITRYQLQQRSL